MQHGEGGGGGQRAKQGAAGMGCSAIFEVMAVSVFKLRSGTSRTCKAPAMSRRQRNLSARL
ncbi:hypothetical protein SS05631_c14910 [Sinorhizobium sp. CCBAU 05631]|nr:hypothetical protein SS05631_c14910 [Sinorhizobium sp. CCBAU 05631]